MVDSRKFHHKRGRQHKRTTESLVQSRRWPVEVPPTKPQPPPSLSIIDFNSLTRGGLEESMGLLRDHSKRRHKRKRRTKKSAILSPETAVVNEVDSAPEEIEDTSDSP